MDESVKQKILSLCSELDEDIDSPSCRKLRQYVEESDDCAAFVDSVKKTIQLYRKYQPPRGLNELSRRLFRELEL